VVAEWPGYPPDAALTLGRAVAGAGARKKARRLGIIEERHVEEEKRQHALRPATKPVRLLGIDVPITPTSDGDLRADDRGKPASAASVQCYLERACRPHQHFAQTRATNSARPSAGGNAAI
jgi:hypothetical protein